MLDFVERDQGERAVTVGRQSGDGPVLQGEGWQRFLYVHERAERGAEQPAVGHYDHRAMTGCGDGMQGFAGAVG